MLLMVEMEFENTTIKSLYQKAYSSYGRACNSNRGQMGITLRVND
jgi:hypothetical protein